MLRSGDAKWKSFIGDVPGGEWLLAVSSVDIMKRVDIEGKESTATVISGHWSGRWVRQLLSGGEQRGRA